MRWYSFLTRLSRTPPLPETTRLLCDNPSCGNPIFGEPIAYHQDSGAIYHPGECNILALVHQNYEQCLRGDTTSLGGFDFISRQQALTLLARGKLAQGKDLEERVSPVSLE